MSKYYSKITKKSVNKFNLGGTPTPSFNISPTNTMNLSVSSTAPTKSFGLNNLGTDYSTNFRNQNVGISNNIGISSSANLLPSTDPLSVGLNSNSVNNLNIETPENNLSLNNNQINPVINEKQNSKIGDWGKVGLEALTGLGGIATGVVDASQIKDTSGYKAEANMIGASGGKGDNYDEALQAYNNIAPARTITARDLMGSKSDRAKAFLGTSLKGLSTGAGIGGTIGGFAGGVGALPGMAIGGAIGLLAGSASAGIGNLVNRVRANRAVKDVNREYQEQRALAIRNQNNKFGNIYNNNNFNALTNSYNMAADGGFIDNYFNMSYNNKFADGGFLSSNGTDFNTGYRYIGNGGTHDENPNEGIQIGVDPQGIPNMVEEGEVVINNELSGSGDYVFSKTKLKPSKETLKEFKLPEKYANKPFADIFLELAKEIDEMPNDPIAKNTIKANTQKLIAAQEREREIEQQKELEKQQVMQQLGLLPQQSMGLEQIMQSQNPNDQVAQEQLMQEQMMQQPTEQEAMGLEGMMAYGGFTNRYDSAGYMNNGWDRPLQNINETKDPSIYTRRGSTIAPGFVNFISNKYPTANGDWRGFQWMDEHNMSQDRFNSLGREYLGIDKDTPLNFRALYDNSKPYGPGMKQWVKDNPISNFGNYSNNNSGNPIIDNFGIPDATPISFNNNSSNRYIYEPYSISDLINEDQLVEHKPLVEPVDDGVPEFIEPDYRPVNHLRYASLAGPALGLALAARKPDYTVPDSLNDRLADSGNFTKVQYSPIGNYLNNKYIDRNYYGTKLGQQYANTVDNLRNLSNGNQSSAMAHLAAADAASIINRADAYMKADEHNWNRYKDVETFNKDTDKFNSENALKAAVTNAELEAQAKQRTLSLAAEAAKYRYLIDKDRSDAIGGNLQALFEGIGNIGRENYAMNQDDWLKFQNYYGTPRAMFPNMRKGRWRSYIDALNAYRKYDERVKYDDNMKEQIERIAAHYYNYGKDEQDKAAKYLEGRVRGIRNNGSYTPGQIDSMIEMLRNKGLEII